MIFDSYIEIAAGSHPIKYELINNTLRVARILDTPYRYPGNYGFIPDTLAEDGDELDVMVITPYPLEPQSIIECRAVGVLYVEDQGGEDNKIIAVPVSEIYKNYEYVFSHRDLSSKLNIVEFFTHYKDNDPTRWSKVKGWGTPVDAVAIISTAQSEYVK